MLVTGRAKADFTCWVYWDLLEFLKGSWRLFWLYVGISHFLWSSPLEQQLICSSDEAGRYTHRNTIFVSGCPLEPVLDNASGHEAVAELLQWQSSRSQVHNGVRSQVLPPSNFQSYKHYCSQQTQWLLKSLLLYALLFHFCKWVFFMHKYTCFWQ